MEPNTQDHTPMDTNTDNGIKNNIYLVVYLIIRIVIATIIFALIPEDSLQRPIIRVCDSILYLLIALEFSRNVKSNPTIAKDFPLMLFMLAGLYLIAEGLIEYPEWFVTVIIYFLSIVVCIQVITAGFKIRIPKFAIPFYFIIPFTAIVYFFSIYLGLIINSSNNLDWMMYSVENFKLSYWIPRIAFHFSHGGVIEDLMFRYFLVHRLRQMKISMFAVVILQASLFSLAHIGKGSIYLLISAFILSVIFCLGYIISKDIRPSMISHALFNLLVEAEAIFYYLG